MGNGIEFGGVRVTTDVHARVVGNREAVKATEHLNSAIDTLINTERLFKEAGLVVEKNFIIRTRREVEKIRDELARAIAL